MQICQNLKFEFSEMKKYRVCSSSFVPCFLEYILYIQCNQSHCSCFLLDKYSDRYWSLRHIYLIHRHLMQHIRFLFSVYIVRYMNVRQTVTFQTGLKVLDRINVLSPLNILHYIFTSILFCLFVLTSKKSGDSQKLFVFCWFSCPTTW